MSTARRVEGKVAQILSNRSLVLNVGKDQGVQLGMIFSILNRRGSDIKDPDTGEALGSVEVEKVQVRITEVKPHLSVGRTFRTKSYGGIQFPAIFQTAQTVVESLSASLASAEIEISAEQSIVDIGDPAISLPQPKSEAELEKTPRNPT